MESPSTPKTEVVNRPYSMDTSPFLVPPTPMMKKIGYGTGVSVYHVDRSPRFGQDRSPWVVKKRNATIKRGNITDRLLKEADILRSLDHPNIVGFRGFTKTADGNEVLVMEECSQSLGDCIETYGQNYGPFSRKTILDVMLGVSQGLHYLHVEKKLIHGDIKSFNILIKDSFQSVKICDFGVSLHISEDGSSKEEYIGSLPWTCPEALENNRPITDRADIFALGLTLYEMLAMKTPHEIEFNESSLSDTSFNSDAMDESIQEPPYGTRPELPALEPSYSDIVSLFNWCTEEDYRKRPSANDITETINSLASANVIVQV